MWLIESLTLHTWLALCIHWIELLQALRIQQSTKQTKIMPPGVYPWGGERQQINK